MKKRFLLLFVLISPLCSCGNSAKDTVILFTNDVHGAVDGTLSYKNLAKLKQNLINENKNVLLFDAGDFISGGLYTGYDKGKSIINIMNQTRYDLVTLGNHEFDYDFTYLKELINSASFPFISTNFYNCNTDGTPTTRFTNLGSKIFSFDGLKVGVVAASTPDSITTSTPSHFKDSNGNFIYTFLEDKMYDCIQKEVDSIKNNSDVIICLSHLGDEDQSANYTASKLAKNTKGINFILDAHTHQLVTKKIVKDKENNDVFICQTGSKFQNIGEITISKNKKVSVDFISLYSDYDEETKKLEDNLINGFNSKMSKEVATSKIEFENKTIGELNLGDLAAESPYYYYNVTNKKDNYNCDLSFVNSGGIRATIPANTTWTLKTCNLIHSFGNPMCLKTFTGDIIKKALEFSVYKYPTYFGGFQQICGLTFDLNKSITSDIITDKNGNYVSGPTEGHERVSNIKIYNSSTKSYEDFIASNNKKYNVSGSAYVLNEGGDGLSMLKDNGTVLDIEYDICDYKILANYLSNFTKDSSANLPEIKNDYSPLSKGDYINLGINYNTPSRISIS